MVSFELFSEVSSEFWALSGFWVVEGSSVVTSGWVWVVSGVAGSAKAGDGLTKAVMVVRLKAPKTAKSTAKMLDFNLFFRDFLILIINNLRDGVAQFTCLL